jgi:tRNA-2-methylthio-N6-dimethylallyladenosine synthase
MTRRVYIETYGCQMNVADTELMLGVLGARVVRPGDPAAADLMLVNTCAVRDNAEQRVIGRMGELKRYKRPGVVLGVVGCMAQRLGQRLLDDAPHVDLVIGPDGYRALPALVGSAQDGRRGEPAFRRGSTTKTSRPSGPIGWVPSSRFSAAAIIGARSASFR